MEPTRAGRSGVAARLGEMLWEPVRAMRAAYLPFLMVYSAYGLSTVTAIATVFWTKDVLQFSVAEQQLALFWATVPWTLKVLVGQFVDVRPILGSPRRAYIFLGAGAVAAGNILLAGLAGGWSMVTAIASPVGVFFIGVAVVSIGLVVQDVTADAMTSEMNPGDEKHARSIQVLARIAVAVGALAASLGAGALALVGRHHSYQAVYLIACVVPLISVAGALIWKQRPVARARWNAPILMCGAGFALFVIGVNVARIPASAEIVWLGTAVAVGASLWVLARRLDRASLAALAATGIVIFVFRAIPDAGPGTTWWQIEVLGFDETFLGQLRIVGSVLGLLGLVLAARALRAWSVAPVLVFITVVATALALPVIGMYYGLHHWTEQHFDFGARTIAIVDIALGSPFADLSMVPVLAFLAMIGRFGNPATWFALGASFTNLALSTAQITTKWLCQLLPVTQTRRDGAGAIVAQADFGNLGVLMILTTALGFVLPLLAIWMFRKQLRFRISPPQPEL